MDENLDVNNVSGWSSRRKATYFWSTILVLTLASSLIFWKFWYKAPTCFDSFQNGDEKGIDCGGSCSLVCPADALAIVQRGDPHIFEIYPGVYSSLAVVENHNITSSASAVPYKFKFYDDGGNLLYERDGISSLPKNATIAIFEGNINLDKKPSRVSFELAPNIAWHKDTDKAPKITLSHSPLLNENVSPKINASILNNSIEDLKHIEVVAMVQDGRDNTIAASRTFVDKLNKGAEDDLFFTWPKPFNLAENICEKSSDVVLAIDRSGSMASISKNPPEPLTAVKSAAANFINLLREGDSAGLVSFATGASVDSSLTQNFNLVSSSTKAISINKDGTQYTNIAEALRTSLAILVNNATSTNSNKIIVLLTDGIATKNGNDTNVAEAEALKEANKAKDAGISIFTIGLGKDIHEDFLKQVASSSSSYFHAPSTGDLKKIYENISSSICKEVPARIEMLYRIGD